MTEWVDIQYRKPPPNALCSVRTTFTSGRAEPYVFVTCSDGEWFWDHLKDEVLQMHEVTHWSLQNA